MPTRDETHHTAGRWQSSVKPLFPGYLFVKVPKIGSHWRSVNSTYGISRLVTLEGSRPAQVSTEIIDALQMRIRENGKLQSCAQLKVGDQVKVVSGPLSHRLAEIEEIPEFDRIYVLLEFMRR